MGQSLELPGAQALQLQMANVLDMDSGTLGQSREQVQILGSISPGSQRLDGKAADQAVAQAQRGTEGGADRLHAPIKTRCEFPRGFQVVHQEGPPQLAHLADETDIRLDRDRGAALALIDNAGQGGPRGLFAEEGDHEGVDRHQLLCALIQGRVDFLEIIRGGGRMSNAQQDFPLARHFLGGLGKLQMLQDDSQMGGQGV